MIGFVGRKKPQNWFRRQLSRQMSRDSSDDCGYETAIAASAFAIKSLEEAGQNQKKMSEGLESSVTKVKSKKEDIIADQPGPGRISRSLTGKEAGGSKQPPGNFLTMILSFYQSFLGGKITR